MGICDRIWQNIESAITFLSGALTKYNALYLLLCLIFTKTQSFYTYIEVLNIPKLRLNH